MPATPSFEQVVDELSGPIHGYLERFTGDAHAAEDLLQEVLVRLAEALPGFRGESSLKTWAFTVATRVAIDHHRRSGARASVVGFEETMAATEDQDVAGGRLVIREMNSCIREVIERLPEDHRAALLLHDFQGLTAAETAAACGCSLATAKIRIHRARTRLKAILQQDCDFYHDPEQVLRCDRKPGNGRAADP